MAQRVEVDTNLKFTADANQADKAINMIINDFKKLDEMTAYLNKHSDSFSDKQILSMRGAYEQLASTITKLYETNYISEKQQAELGDAFVKSWGNFYSTLYNCGRSLDSIMSKAESGPANINIELTKTNKELGLTEEKLEHIRQRARELHEEYVKGDISRADFSESISKLAGESNIENSSEQIDEVNSSLGKLNSNADEADKILDILSSKLGLSRSEFTQLGKAIGLSGAELTAFAALVGVAVYTVKKLSESIDEMIDTFIKVGSAIGKGTLSGIDWLVDSLGNLGRLLSETAVNGIEAFVDALGSMMGSVEDAITLLDKLSDAGMEIERAFLTTSAYIGKDATDNVYNFINSISDASNTMFQSINDVVAATGSMGLASDQLVEATENMTIMGRNLGVLIGDTKRAFQDLGTTISKGYIGRNSILYRIFTKQEIDQVRKLSSEVDRYNFILERAGRVQELYNAYIQTASGKVSLLRMQYQELMTNIGTIALNLYAIVAPVLTKILTIANQLLSVLMSIFGWKPESVGFSSIASDIGESLDKIGGSAQKASKQLAKFDDVIQINDNKSGGGGVGGIDPQALGDFSGILDDALEKSDEFVKLWEHFKELMEAGDFFGAGEEFMKVVSKLLTDIPWEDIKKKAGDVGEAIAKFLNGMFNVDNKNIVKAWQNVGKTIAEALNTVIRFFDKFLTELNFENIGKALGYAWTSLWENLDIEGAGHTLYEAITGVFQFALGFLSTGGLQKAATALAGIWKSLFSNFKDTDLNEVAGVFTLLINDIISTLYIAVDAVTDEDVQSVVFKLFNKIIEAFKNGSTAWGTSLGATFNNITDFIKNFFKEIDFGGIGEGLGRAWKSLWETIDAKNVADGLYSAIMDAFDFVAGWLKGGGLTTAANKIAEAIKDFFSNFTEQDLIDMTEVAVNIINDLLNALGTIAQALTSDEVKNVVMGLITKLVEAFKENGPEWGAKLNDIIASVLDFILEAIQTADAAGIDGAISDFLNKLNLTELLEKYVSIKIRLWAKKAWIWIQTHWLTLLAFFLDAVHKVGAIIDMAITLVGGAISGVIALLMAFGAWLGNGLKWVGESILGLLDKIVAGIQTWWEWFSGNIEKAFTWITDTLLPNLWTDISTWASSIWSDIQQWPNKIYELFVSIGDIIVKTVLGFIEDVENIFNDFWGFIERIFSPDTWAEAGSAAINGIWNAIKSVWNNTIGNISLDIPGIGDWNGIHIAVPKLATGAIVTGPTNALIGEAGPEAVLPLKNNTQWMDALAAKINNKTGNGGTIRVELADKPFYTRAEMYEFGALVVDSLKAYGLNIAMV